MPNISNESDDKAGAWLTWPVVEALVRLKLRQASRWRVFLAVLLVSARYGGRDARLGVDDLSRMTGLAPRTVKGAIAALRDGGLVVRVRRARLLSVPLLRSKTTGSNGPAVFTRRQELAIAAIMTEASKLLGGDATSLIIPAAYAQDLGLQSPISYRDAYGRLKQVGNRRQAAIFVAAVLALSRDEQVQGRELS